MVTGLVFDFGFGWNLNRDAIRFVIMSVKTHTFCWALGQDRRSCGFAPFHEFLSS